MEEHAEHPEVRQDRQQIGLENPVGPLPLGDVRRHVTVDEPRRYRVFGEAWCSSPRFSPLKSSLVPAAGYQRTWAPAIGSSSRPHRHSDRSISGWRPSSSWLTSFPVMGPAVLPNTCPAVRTTLGLTSSTIGTRSEVNGQDAGPHPVDPDVAQAWEVVGDRQGHGLQTGERDLVTDLGGIVHRAAEQRLAVGPLRHQLQHPLPRTDLVRGQEC